MIQIRVHGRGGQGAVASAEMIAISAIEAGLYAQAFPSFGPERRGAPVIAYARIDKEPILRRDPIAEPDIVVVLDPTVLRAADVKAGLSKGGFIIVNTAKGHEELVREHGFENCSLVLLDATKLAIEIIGRPITNTAMLGALAKITDEVSLEGLFEATRNRFPAVAEKNIEAMKAAHNSANVVELAVVES